MKTTFQKRALLLCATSLGMILAAGTATSAPIVQTVNQSGADANGWASAIWGSPAAVANSSNDYETTNTFFLRTPNNSTPAAFAGKSVTIDPGGTLYLKQTEARRCESGAERAPSVHGGTAVTSPLLEPSSSGFENQFRSNLTQSDICCDHHRRSHDRRHEYANHCVMLSGNPLQRQLTNSGGFFESWRRTKLGSQRNPGQCQCSLTATPQAFSSSAARLAAWFGVKPNTNTVTLNAIILYRFGSNNEWRAQDWRGFH
jgi:hypothetical protein